MARLARAMADAQVRQLAFGDTTLQIVVRRMRRKTLAIHVFPDRPVELRIPLRCPEHEIARFLDDRRDWILESVQGLAGDNPPVLPTWCAGEVHHFLGRPLALALQEGRTRRVSATDTRLLVRCPDPGDPGSVQTALERFFRAEATRLFTARLEVCRARFRDPLPSSSLVVRKMKSKWGSCSSRGEICLNTLLVQKPLAAIDFVVTHELCHLVHFAHNPAFYRLMDRTLPDWREREKLLGPGDGRLQLDLF